MSRQVQLLVFAVFSLVISGSTVIQANDGDRDSRLIQSFSQHIDSLEQLNQTDKQKLRSSLEGASVDAITDLLIQIYPQYSAAVDSSDDDQVTVGVQLLTPLASSTDKFLAADASFFLARMLMNHQRFEEAMPHLEGLATELYSYSAHKGEIHFFLGVAQAGLLQRDEAIRSFREFLEFYPEAPERLRVTAWRQVQELQALEEGKLQDVQRHMEFSRRRLDQRDTGEQTQQKQDKIVKMLAKLIEEEEKKECNSSCKNSNQSKSKQENPSAPKQSQDPKGGQSESGGSSANPNGEVVEKSYDDSPASPWSRLRDRSRDPANNAIKEKLPARYRDIVERYFEAANEADK